MRLSVCSFLFTLVTLSFPLHADVSDTVEPVIVEEGPQVPTDFVRDIMQPLGMPLVSFFHAIRESLFLNSKLSKPHPLEAVGDFFLTPSRYLFAGKKVVIKDETLPDYEIIQTYPYKKLHWLKALSSLVALPVSYTVGTTLKGTSYLFPEVRRRHRKIKRAQLQIHSHLEEYHHKGILSFHEEEFIPCQGHQRPSQLTHKQKVEIQALKTLTELLDAQQILYWIDCGTCLGAYRYGGIIPWDWDIDISIMLEDHENVKQLLSTLDPEKYQIQDWSSYSKPKTFLKLYVKETHNFIDIYHYEINEEKKTLGYLFTYIDSPFPKSWKISELKCTKPLQFAQVFPLKKAKFDTLTVWAPQDTVSFLQSKYGTNLDPTMVWNVETKTYTKVENHPFFNKSI